VPPYYDSMIGKLIARGKNRDESIRRMEIALDETICEGIKTTIPFHHLALRSADFRSGNLSTRFVEELLKMDGAATRDKPPLTAAAEGAAEGAVGTARATISPRHPRPSLRRCRGAARGKKKR
jgi:acetyl/propionyl-CoA carboxylase alpha subunit